MDALNQLDDRGYTSDEWLKANGLSPCPWPEGSDESRLWNWAVSERDEPGPAIFRVLARLVPVEPQSTEAKREQRKNRCSDGLCGGCLSCETGVRFCPDDDDRGDYERELAEDLP